MKHECEQAAIKSAIYRGWIRHRRFEPKSHAFRYPLFMLYLDLDELPELFSSKWFCSLERFNVVSFRRDDFFKPEQTDLKQAVIDHVSGELANQGLTCPEIQSVRMLGHLRYFGYIFNPVTFYYCFDEADTLIAIMAEIHNTPWGERHAYVLPIGLSGRYGEYRLKGKNRHCFDFEKVFHVSPFNPMNMDYHWVFSEVEQDLKIHMDTLLKNADQGQDEPDKHFDATLLMSRASIEEKFASTLIRFPFMTVKVVTGIYWQAMKLWFKGLPFYDHPESGKRFDKPASRKRLLGE